MSIIIECNKCGATHTARSGHNCPYAEPASAMVEISRRELDGLLAKVEELSSRLEPIWDVHEKYKNKKILVDSNFGIDLLQAIRKAVEGK